MPELTELMTLTATLSFNPIGKAPSGFRLDVPFEGTATSPLWEGERPVAGVDHVTVDGNGLQQLDIRGRVGAGKETVAYRAMGRGDDAGPREVFTFETANPDLAWLNGVVGVGFGTIDGDQLTLVVSTISA